MLKTVDKNTPIECISKPISFDPHQNLPPNYKLSYGIRYSGINEESQKPMFYGFDLFYQVTGNGLDLEGFLTFCFTNNFHIDWYNFQRTSKERGKWTYKTLIKKLSYPIIEIYGKEYWEKLKYRFMYYEWTLMDPEIKKELNHMFQ